MTHAAPKPLRLPLLFALLWTWGLGSAAVAAETGAPDSAEPPDRPLGEGFDDLADTAPASVVGGMPSVLGDWPHAGALYVEGFFACSAVLIAPDVVLSAGHCFNGAFTSKEVVLDTVDHTEGEGGEVLPVLEGFRYDDHYNTFDASVFVLERPATTPPAPLLRDCLVEDYLRVGADVSIVGYGALDVLGLQTTTELHEARTTVIDPECEDLTAGCNRDVSPGGELIAGGEGVDSCVGDSGGPLYLHTPEGPHLVGLTSRAALPTQTPCGNGGIYVRVDALLDWIETVTQRTLPGPDCGILNRAPSPEALPIEVGLAEAATTQIDPGDPDEADVHTFAIVRPPAWGTAAIDPDGRVTYRGSRYALGDTALRVRVTDSAGAWGELEVEVLSVVQPAAGGCQCTSSGEPLGMFAGVWLLVAWRRERRGKAP